MNKNIYFVGPRYNHHSKYSGYDNFSRLIGHHIPALITNRYLSDRIGYYPLIGDLGWRLDQFAAILARQSLYSFPVFLLEVCTAFHMMRNNNSVYHVLYGDSDLCFTGYLKNIGNHKLIATFHNPPSILEWLKLEKAIKKLDAVIILSEYQRSYFENIMPREKIFRIYHAIDTDFFVPSMNKHKEEICITVGSKLRDFETFSTAIDLVLSKRPNVRFIAIGCKRTDASTPRLENNKVEFIDNITDEELLNLYQISCLAVFPLLDATANNAMLEAMACGLPIVVTDVGGASEYLGEKNAILCEPHNSDDMAKAIIQILENKKLSKSLSDKSRKRSLDFDLSIICKQLINFYQDLNLYH